MNNKSRNYLTGIVPDFQLEQKENKYFRSPIYLEQQFFGTKNHSYFLRKNETNPLSEYGLNLKLSEKKALTVVQILLEETDYKGNDIFIDIDSPRLHGKYKCPSIDVSFYDYLKIYGLTEKQIKGGKRRKEALQSLYELEKTYRIAYTKKVKVKSTKEIKTIAVCCDIRLLSIAQMTILEEQSRSITEVEKDNRARFLRITIGPLFLEQIKSFYTLKPYFLFQEIESVKQGASKRKSNILLIDWLLTINTIEIKISEENLGYKLRLESYIKDRKKTQVTSIIEEAIKISHNLDFIKSWKKTDNIFEFKLNPARCSRLKNKSISKTEKITPQELKKLSLPDDHGF